MTRLFRLMLRHPNSVGESYFEHMRFALQFAVLLSTAAFCAFVHALLPFCFEKTASRLVCRLHQRIANRGEPDQTENGPHEAARLVATE
jgi:hypothetical protein